jgi:hypothetical protein
MVYNDAVIRSDYMASNERMINNKRTEISYFMCLYS